MGWLILRIILMIGCFTFSGYISHGIVMYGFKYVEQVMNDADLAKRFLVIVEVAVIAIWYINKFTTKSTKKKPFSFKIKSTKIVLPTLSTIIFYFLVVSLIVTSVIPATLGVEVSKTEKIVWMPDEAREPEIKIYEDLIISKKEFIVEKKEDYGKTSREYWNEKDEKKKVRLYWKRYRAGRDVEKAEEKVTEYESSIESEVKRYEKDKNDYEEQLKAYKEQRKSWFKFVIKHFWESIVIIILQAFNLWTSHKGSSLLEDIIADIKKMTKKDKKDKSKKNSNNKDEKSKGDNTNSDNSDNDDSTPATKSDEETLPDYEAIFLENNIIDKEGLEYDYSKMGEWKRIDFSNVKEEKKNEGPAEEKEPEAKEVEPTEEPIEVPEIKEIETEERVEDSEIETEETDDTDIEEEEVSETVLSENELMDDSIPTRSLPFAKKRRPRRK